MERGVEFLDEFLQLFTVDIADCEELETLRSPASNVVSLHCLQLRCVTFGGSAHDRIGPLASGIRPRRFGLRCSRYRLPALMADLDIAQTFAERGYITRGETIALRRSHECHDRHRRLLRPRSERPRGRRAADELHSVPRQPGPDCRIPNWRGSVRRQWRPEQSRARAVPAGPTITAKPWRSLIVGSPTRQTL